MSTKFISNLFYSFISLLMLTSCENDGVRTFSLESNIHNLNPHYQRKGYQFNVQNDTLIILNSYSKDTLFEAYDLESGQLIGKFGQLGNGPKEISRVSGIDWLPGSQKMYVGDASRSNIRIFDADSALNNWDYKAPRIGLPKDLFPAYFQLLTENSFVTRQMDQTDDVLLKFNAKQVYDTLGKQYRTNDPLVLGDDFIQYYFFFNGKHPTQEKYVVSYFNYDIIQIIEEDGSSIFFQGPDKVNYSDRKKEFMTYRNCALTEDYILAAYIGKEFEMPAVSAPNPEEIHIISWDGEFLRKFKLDVPIHYFILSEDNSRIYAFADNENRDFVSFKIPELK